MIQRNEIELEIKILRHALNNPSISKQEMEELCGGAAWKLITPKHVHKIAYHYIGDDFHYHNKDMIKAMLQQCELKLEELNKENERKNSQEELNELQREYYAYKKKTRWFHLLSYIVGVISGVLATIFKIWEFLKYFQ